MNERNIHKINDLALGRKRPDINMQALYRLIQHKGEPIKTSDTRMNGVNALEYSEGQYIAMIRTATQQAIKQGSFYPCAIQIIQLTKL